MRRRQLTGALAGYFARMPRLTSEPTGALSPSPGRPIVFMPYIGGFPVYVQKCNDVMTSGYDGFTFADAAATNAAPQVRFTERWHVPLDIEVISPGAVAARRVPVV